MGLEKAANAKDSIADEQNKQVTRLKGNFTGKHAEVKVIVNGYMHNGRKKQFQLR